MAAHSILLLSATFYFLLTYQIEIIGITAILSFAFLYSIKYLKHKQTKFLFEAANIVTGIRWILLVILLFFPFSTLQIASIASVVLVADGLDGFLARKFKTASAFGEYLDMETDAFYVLVLSSLLYQNGTFGIWILSLGLLRYLYFIALLFVKPVQQKEERIFQARLIAVILMSTLIASFILPLTIARPAIFISAILLFYSFGRGFWMVLKQDSSP